MLPEAPDVSPRAPADVALGELVRREYGLVVAHVCRLVGDLDLAEELVQEATLRALEAWREQGVPERPGAWLLVAARRRALDRLREHRRRPSEPFDDASHASPASESAVEEPELETLRDDMLRLFFTCAHPLLPREAQVALALRGLAGFETAAIARAFLQSESTIAQRLVRAKKTLRDRRIPYRVPTAWELPERIPAVLEIVYLVFNAGHSPPMGARAVDDALCAEAIRLGGLLAEALPGCAEAWGLLALMELHGARIPARTDAAGEIVLLDRQDRSRWDVNRLSAGFAHLSRAREATDPGALVLQAEIAACHARSPSAAETDWPRIAALYAELAARFPSPVVALNHAVAIGMADGPASGLRAVETLADEPRLAGYAWLASARAEFLDRLGRHAEAATAFADAARQTENEAERGLLERRSRECLGADRDQPAHDVSA